LAQSDTHQEVRRIALDALGWQGRKVDRDFLLARATDPDPEIRNAVASNLTNVSDMDPPDPDVLTALLQLAADRDPEVQFSAVWALSEEIPSDAPGVSKALEEAAAGRAGLPQTATVAQKALERIRRRRSV